MQAKPTPISEKPSPEQLDTMADEFDQCLSVLVAEGSFPSFDEFKKNPDKYRERPDALFESIDRSMVTGRRDLAKQKIYWRYGKESFTLGKLERVCKENGYRICDVDIIPFRNPNSSGTGKDEIYVRVFPKSELRAMGAVIPNG
jgi:hypothetical protein